jgi:hypothetical protein
MKKFSLVLILVLVLTLSGCAAISEEDYDALMAEKEALETEKTDLQADISDLEDELEAVVVDGDFTPGTYYGYDSVGGYMAIVFINEEGGIEDVIFDAMYHGSTKQILGDAYGMGAITGKEWYEHADALAAEVVANQGWSTISITETTLDSTWDALSVPNHVIEFDGFAGATIGAEGFVFAWNDAISQATTAGTLGVVDTTLTAAEWAAAHEPAFDYVDGVYFGFDATSEITVKITIVDGVITEVFFDALHEMDPDDTADSGDEYYTTKQVLGEDYGMATADGQLEWFEQANKLAAAIIEYQEWTDAWTIETVASYGGGTKDIFDDEDQDVIDDLAGVTIGVDGFEAAWNNAIAQATPAE